MPSAARRRWRSWKTSRYAKIAFASSTKGPPAPTVEGDVKQVVRDRPVAGLRRLAVGAGVLLPAAAVAWGLLTPRTPATSLVLPAALIVSGALIGRWWAPLPSIAVVAALSVAELGGIGRSGSVIELHAGGFSLGFLVAASLVAAVVTLVGVLARRVGSALLAGGGRNRWGSR